MHHTFWYAVNNKHFNMHIFDYNIRITITYVKPSNIRHSGFRPSSVLLLSRSLHPLPKKSNVYHNLFSFEPTRYGQDSLTDLV